ncbi:MAG TPA: tetratricopeptide repeat protein [Polyangia bacterium]
MTTKQGDPPGPARPMAQRQAALVLGGILGIVGLVVAAYLPAIRGGFVWDDDSWTTKIAALLSDASGLRAIWFRPTAMQQYYPLTGTSFWIDFHLWGFHPLPYHLENVLLHAASAVLVWRLLRRLGVPGSWTAGALFALHPMMVESAAWITERKNVLSVALFLAAFRAYASFAQNWRDDWREADAPRDSPAPAVIARRRRVAYLLAFLLFLCALLAKTVACTFPAVVLLVSWWKRGRVQWRRDVLPLLPFFVAASGMSALTTYLEAIHAGARGPEYLLTFPQRILIAGRAFWFYLDKLFWPANLCFVYPRWSPDPLVWTQWLYPVAAVASLGALWFARRRVGRGPLTAVLFYTGTLFPALGFVNLYYMRYSFVCDHWSYLPSIGIMALFGSFLAAISERVRRSRLTWAVIVGAVLVTLGILTSQQAGMYVDLESLWRTTLARNPDCWIAYTNLGNLLFRRGDVDEAIVNLQRALRIKPDLYEAHTSLGVALASSGNLGAALAELQTAIAINPAYAEAHYDLALVHERAGKLEDALRELQEAVRLKPNFTVAQRRLGVIGDEVRFREESTPANGAH